MDSVLRFVVSAQRTPCRRSRSEENDEAAHTHPSNESPVVGAVGSELTEITLGIEAGDTVILADLNAPISSSETETESGLAGLGGDTSTELRTPPVGMVGPPAG